MGVPADLIKIEECLRAYDWQPVSGVAAYPDAKEVLPILVSNKVEIGVVTNAYYPMWMRDRELDAFGLLGHFADCRISSADVGYLKPHPAIFEAALRCLKARPDEVVFIGDNPEADIAGSQAVGMRAVMRIGKKAPPLISGLIVPDGAINSLHELLPLLDTWYPTWRTNLEAAKTTADTKTQAGEIDGSVASNPIS
jgi:HAD superfamily hydrolase (TIGR01509 family)